MTKLGQQDGVTYLIDFGLIDEDVLSHVLSTDDFPTSVEQAAILQRIDTEMNNIPYNVVFRGPFESIYYKSPSQKTRKSE